MEEAYGAVEDYQTRLVITGFGKDHVYQKMQRIIYTFKKPDKFRIEFEFPHEGMLLAYPDSKGKVAVRPKFWGRLTTFHLDPGNPFLEISPGQQINQTDLGLLIVNIRHSLTDMFLGELEVTAGIKHIVIRVLSDNPFRRGVPRRYVFTIDKEMWLPVAVEEATEEKVLQRTVVYDHIKVNLGVKDSFFHID